MLEITNTTIEVMDLLQINNPQLILDLENGLYKIDKQYYNDYERDE